MAYSAYSTFRNIHVAKCLGGLPELDAIDNLLAGANRECKGAQQLWPSKVRKPHIDKTEQETALLSVNHVKDHIGQEGGDL